VERWSVRARSAGSTLDTLNTLNTLNTLQRSYGPGYSP
jgi:hypothetical protein